MLGETESTACSMRFDQSDRQKELEAAGFSLTIFRNLNTPEELEAERRRA